jgi:alkanesulfonate monooxygenase SsuD/methylene tetrahydromethanopterin reductase-like flavin-dependent oxidoreductase (luciferase family)
MNHQAVALSAWPAAHLVRRWRPPRRHRRATRPLARTGLLLRPRYFTSSGAELQPRRTHPPSIWLGAFGDEDARAGRAEADGWLRSLFLLEPERGCRSRDRIGEVASRAGYDPKRPPTATPSAC